jgi:hypothetical protein
MEEREPRQVTCERVVDVLRDAATTAAQPVVCVLEADGAELNVVVGDPSGTVLVYYPPNYDGVGSCHSVGNQAAIAVDSYAGRAAWNDPPLTAFYFGHHTEFARWMVVDHGVAEAAARQFCDQPSEPPSAVVWEID